MLKLLLFFSKISHFKGFFSKVVKLRCIKFLKTKKPDIKNQGFITPLIPNVRPFGNTLGVQLTPRIRCSVQSVHIFYFQLVLNSSNNHQLYYMRKITVCQVYKEQKSDSMVLYLICLIFQTQKNDIYCYINYNHCPYGPFSKIFQTNKFQKFYIDYITYKKHYTSK